MTLVKGEAPSTTEIAPQEPWEDTMSAISPLTFETMDARYELSDASNPESKGWDVDILSVFGDRVNYEMRSGYGLFSIISSGVNDGFLPGVTKQFARLIKGRRNGSRDLLPEEMVHDPKNKGLLNKQASGIAGLIKKEMARQVSP